MNKEMLSSKQVIYIMLMFLLGSSVVIGVSPEVGQDGWISLLSALICVFPIIIMYSRISSLYPGKNIYDIMQDIYKPVIGKFLIILMTLYALYLGALVLRNIGEFMKIISLPSTPFTVILICMIIIVMYLSLSGIKTFGRATVLAFYLVISMYAFTVILSFGKLDVKNLFPIADHSIKELFDAAFRTFSFPFAETVLFLAFADHWRRDKKNNSYKNYICGLLIGGFILLTVVLRNVSILGANTVESAYFPSFLAARVIGIPNFLERIEGAVTYNFILLSIAKITVCLIASAKGAVKLFGIKDYKVMIAPSALMIMAICLFANTDIVEMFDFLDVYKIFALPFQIFIPFIVWIGAEIILRIRKKKEENNSEIAPES